MADIITDPGTGCTLREMAGRDGQDGQESDAIMRRWLIRGSSDPIVCRQAIINQAVATSLFQFENLPLTTMTWKLFTGPDAWEFTVNYALQPLIQVGQYTISMDTTGATTKQTEAFAQTVFPAPGKTPRQFATTINVQDDKPEGIDRVIPSLKLDINAKIASRFLASPIAYAALVASMTGSMNGTSFLGFAPGELLFMGASGQIVGENPTLTYTFEASANLTGVTIGPVSGISKWGHDFLWFDYIVKKDSSSNLQISEPRAAYVARVYGTADFSLLGIGQV